MATRPQRAGFTLSFRQIRCACGIERISGVACRDCGRRPAAHEVDPKAQRRRTASTSAQALLTQGDPTIQAVNLEQGPLPIHTLHDVNVKLRNWMERLWPALNGADKDSVALVRSVRELIAIQAAYDAIPQIRPWINASHTVKDTLAAATEMLRECLGILACREPLYAQEHQAKMQAHLDEMECLIGIFAEWIENLTQAISLDEYTDILPFLAEIAASRTAGLQEIEHWQAHENRGAKLFAEISGSSPSSCPAGLGIHLILVEASIEVIGDSRRFISKAKDAASIFLNDPRAAREIVMRTRWAGEMTQRIIDTYDSGRRAFLSISLAQYNREVIVGLLAAGHALVEAGSRPQIAALHAMASRQDYESVRSCSAGNVLSQFEAAGYDRLTEGIYRPIRHAWAHSAFRDTGNNVEFLDDSGAVKSLMSYDDLLNSVIAGYETVAALTAGLLCACSKIGVDVTSILPAVENFPIAPQLQMLATYFSWRDLEVSQSSDTEMEIITDLPDGGPSVMAIIAISSIMPQDIEFLRIVTHDNQIKAEVPLALMREFSSREGLDQQLSFIRFQRNLIIDGSPLYNEEQFRHAIACWAIQAIVEEDPIRAVGDLRKLKRIAEMEGDEKLVSALTGSIAVQRAGWMGITSGDREMRGREWIVDYAQRNL
jgi:hypothetical protein